jgi:hypothetical protein
MFHIHIIIIHIIIHIIHIIDIIGSFIHILFLYSSTHPI